jgi:6-bladed beta-propeller
VRPCTWPGIPSTAALLVLVPLVLSCDFAPDCPAPDPGWVHAVPISDCVSPATGRLEQSAFDAFAGKIEALDSVLTIGVFDGPDEYIFARITDVDMDNQGNYVVADSRSREVRVYDRSGKFKQTVGSAGEGPGEFGYPTLIAFDRAGLLYVEDGRLRLQRFRNMGNGYEYHDQLRFELRVEDLCIMRDTIYVQGWRRGESPADSAIHKYTLTGEHVQSFGQVYAHDDAFFVENYTRGRLSCIESLNAVAYVPRQSPGQVRLYQSTGTLSWITTLPETQGVVLSITERGPTVTWPETGVHGWLTLSHVDGRTVLMQRSFAIVGEPDAYRLESYVFDGRTGYGRFLGDTLPQMTFVGDAEAVSVRRDPFPALVIYR